MSIDNDLLRGKLERHIIHTEFMLKDIEVLYRNSEIMRDDDPAMDIIKKYVQTHDDETSKYFKDNFLNKNH
jgi:hypothetical protein